MENNGAHLQESDKMALFHLLLAYSDILSSSEAGPRQISSICYEITTTKPSPIQQHIPQIPPIRRVKVHQPTHHSILLLRLIQTVDKDGLYTIFN